MRHLFVSLRKPRLRYDFSFTAPQSFHARFPQRYDRSAFFTFVERARPSPWRSLVSFTFVLTNHPHVLSPPKKLDKHCLLTFFTPLRCCSWLDHAKLDRIVSTESISIRSRTGYYFRRRSTLPSEILSPHFTTICL